MPFPSPRDLLNPGIEPGSPALQADSLLTELQGKHLPLVIPSVYSVGEGEGGKIWENGIETRKISCMK